MARRTLDYVDEAGAGPLVTKHALMGTLQYALFLRGWRSDTDSSRHAYPQTISALWAGALVMLLSAAYSPSGAALAPTARRAKDTDVEKHWTRCSTGQPTVQNAL